MIIPWEVNDNRNGVWFPDPKTLELEGRLDSKNILLGKGTHGSVYAISEFHVIKVKDPLSQDYLRVNTVEQEFWIQKKLYDLGISVPFPEGVFNLQLKTEQNGWQTQEVIGLVMERINGKPVSKSPRVIPFIDEWMKREIAKMRQAQIDYSGPHYHDIIYDSKTGRIALVDFTLYKLKQQIA